MKNKSLFIITILFIFASMQVFAQTTICEGDTVMLQGTDYQDGDLKWQISTDGDFWEDISGATSLTYSFVPAEDAWYRLQITDPNCNPAVYHSDEQQILVKTTPQYAIEITGDSIVCQGDISISYTVTDIPDANFTWSYTGSGLTFDSGQGTHSVDVSFTSDATSGDLILTLSNECGEGTVSTLNLTLNAPSEAPASISGEIEICSGDSTELSVSGGNLGTDATWEWFTQTCSGTSIGSGSSIEISPTSTTTYFVRAAGICNVTACVETTVTVNTIPDSPIEASIIPGIEEIEWNWSSVSDADGYKYNTTQDFSSATDNGLSTSFNQTGLSCEEPYSLYVWSYNECGHSAALILEESTEDCGACPTLNVGDLYGGGIVAATNYPGVDCGYFIVALQDASSSAQWGCFHSNSSADISTTFAIGAGMQNTMNIVAFHDSLTNYYGNPTQCNSSNDGSVAAKLCDDDTLEGYSDWFLPAREELALIEDSLYVSGLGNFSATSYWSSNDAGPGLTHRAYEWLFGTGSVGPKNKFDLYRVRCVRAF